MSNPADRAAISSAAHLKEWLRQSGREFLILHTEDLVDALRWPDGVQTLIDIIDKYREYRCAQGKAEVLEADEQQRVIEFLQTK